MQVVENILKISVLFLCLHSVSYADVAKKQAAINEDSQEILQMLYKKYPSAQAAVNSAYGYATFNSAGINLIFFSAEGGSGVAVRNDKERIYMKMASGGFGIGLGVKDFKAIFIFENKKVFDDFIEHGWEANAQVDATAKADNKGAGIEGAVTVQPGVRLFKLTKTGLALQATIQGTKYWKDSKLNP